MANETNEANDNAVIVGELPKEMPLPAMVAARTAIVGYATAVDAVLVLFVGPEVHVMLVEPERVLLEGRITRLSETFAFWGIKPTVVRGATAKAHVDALLK